MAAPAPAVVLAIEDLACRRGGRPVFAHVSATLAGGELLALVGRNGSGKTTLLRALALLTPHQAGTIKWQGRDVAEAPEAWRGQLAWLGHVDGLKGDLTLAENLVAAERLRGAGTPSTSRLDDALAAFDLAPLAARPARTLSAGQRRRAALARVVLSAAPLWLLDEPTNALDGPAQAALRTALQHHLDAGGIVVAATHAPLDIAGARILELGSSEFGAA
jgi:heme exporter protein A